jgi:hypothetical protein
MALAMCLITNAEWQTLARNIELVAVNWSSGTIGSGSLNRGHSDNAPPSSLAADVSDFNACSGTGQTCSNITWDSQRRTHVLSTGQVIWDFAGNVMEWVKDTNSIKFGADANMSQVTATSHKIIGTIGLIKGTAKFLFGSSRDYIGLNSGEYGGLGYGWLNYSGGGINRGGSWMYGVDAGFFTVYLYNATSDSFPDVGFRCAYHP